MTELFGALVGFYIAFNHRWLWAKFSGATDVQRYAFGAAVFVLGVAVWWGLG